MAEPMRGRGGSGLAYAVLSFALRRPRLLRALAAVVRRWPRALAGVGAANYTAVNGALQRPCAFSGTAHQPNLVAGEFVIGMEHAARHHADRALLERVLGAAPRSGAAAGAEAQARLAAVAGGAFDLVDDLLVWTLWAGLAPVFSGYGDAIARPVDPPAGSATPEPAPDARALALFHDLRHVGAHLLVGQVAPAPLHSRAQSAGASIRERVEGVLPALAAAWGASDLDQARRVAVGLPWVGHPASVQAGALLVSELLARPTLLADLQRQAQALTEPLGDARWRALLREHLLELLRFNPVFPIVQRDVPRTTLLEVGAGRPAQYDAGATLRVLLIGAMHDPAAFPQPDEYRPRRSGGADPTLHFGLGPRFCPGRDHVIEMLVSTLTVLLRAGTWERPPQRGVVYDGPVIRHFPLIIRAGTP